MILALNNELIKYILEQSGAVIIAIFLIVRIESKLDNLNETLIYLTETFSRAINKKRKIAKSRI